MLKRKTPFKRRPCAVLSGAGAVVALVAALTTPAAALVIPNVAFFDDFENPADAGLRLRLHAKWGSGAGPENLNLAWGGDRAIRLRAFSGTGATSSATQVTNFAPGMGGGAFLQAMTFTLQSDTANQLTGSNHLTIQLNESGGGELARWYGHSGAVTPRFGGTVGPPVDITDGAVHEFSITYNAATGETNWLHNNAVQWTQALTTGFIAERVYVEDVSRGIEDHVYLDDLVVGYIPEPGSLLLLGMASLGLMRSRRRAA